MALPPSGPISLNQVNVELGRPATQVISLGSPEVRALAQVPSGPISMSNLYGKSSVFTLTISANAGNVNLRDLAIANGWDQVSKFILNINSGVVVASSSAGNAALIINGLFTNGLTINNSGSIVGKGGDGGRGDGIAGGPGGPGMNINTNVTVTINNLGIIAGGGGGGGGGPSYKRNGSGGGGGRSSDQYPSAGGAAGSTGITGAGPGSPGNYAGAGNAGGTDGGGRGGNGGNWGAIGANGQTIDSNPGGTGGQAGAAILRNGGAVYFEAQGQIFGAIA